MSHASGLLGAARTEVGVDPVADHHAGNLRLDRVAIRRDVTLSQDAAVVQPLVRRHGEGTETGKVLRARALADGGETSCERDPVER